MEAIADALHAEPGDVWLRERASKHALEEALLADYRVLALATRGRAGRAARAGPWYLLTRARATTAC